MYNLRVFTCYVELYHILIEFVNVGIQENKCYKLPVHINKYKGMKTVVICPVSSDLLLCVKSSNLVFSIPASVHMLRAMSSFGSLLYIYIFISCYLIALDLNCIMFLYAGYFCDRASWNAVPEVVC
jgi:hypothetical protein